MRNNPVENPMRSSKADIAEIEKFDAMSGRWWEPEGPFKPLHKMNPIRLSYLKSQICAQFERDPKEMKPLQGLSVFDVGCGGGLLSEPLARLGADVTGLDGSSAAISAARAHAKEMGLDIRYEQAFAHEIAERGEQADIVTAMEIVEHVEDQAAFVASIAKLLKPGGLLAMSTLNRTSSSYLTAILGAEYLLRWLPVGTHDWNAFPTPDELGKAAMQAGLTVLDRSGFTYNPLLDQWRLSDDLSINYVFLASR